VVTHDPETARNAGRIIRLRDGWVVSDGPGTGLDEAGNNPPCSAGECA